MCTFWYVEALARSGRLDDARLTFEKMLTYSNPLGLYSEEIALSGEQTGNFPQAFSHLSLINAAVHSTSNSTPAPEPTKQHGGRSASFFRSRSTASMRTPDSNADCVIVSPRSAEPPTALHDYGAITDAELDAGPAAMRSGPRKRCGRWRSGPS
jgi:hypothetical protein